MSTFSKNITLPNMNTFASTDKSKTVKISFDSVFSYQEYEYRF